MKISKYIFVVLIFFSSTQGMDLDRIINLEGEWRIEIGDNQDFVRPDFDDSNWEKITVPSCWEDQGFPGYDGYAWYRISFQAPKNMSTQHLYLKLGRIDDVDNVYLNGVFIGGRGVLPPKYRTAYNVKRCYDIPERLIRRDAKNVIAVRVYDHHGAGGIIKGEVGIYFRKDYVNLDIDLCGEWKFLPGDNIRFSSVKLNDLKWNTILVPARWEDEGYPELDGFAWYRKKLVIDKKLANKKLILMLGKINDIDETYFNGKLIGTTGDFMENNRKKNLEKGYYKMERAYFIPPALIKPNKQNIIAVRIFDLGRHGGIYAGDVGIVARDEFLEYKKRKD